MGLTQELNRTTRGLRTHVAYYCQSLPPQLKTDLSFLVAADLAENEKNVQRLLKRDRKELLATENNFIAEWDRPGTTPRKEPAQDDEPSSSKPVQAAAISASMSLTIHSVCPYTG